MLYPLQDLSIIIPVVNEDHATLKAMVNELTMLGAEVIVVDDGSINPYPNSIKHGYNYGYGSALMTGIKNSNRSIIMTMDGDGQHTVEDAIKLYTVWKLLDIDMLIGMRRLKNESPLRFFGRKFLNSIASFLALTWINDLNSGMRIFKKDIAQGYFPILCRQFSFTTSLTMSMMCDDYKVEYFPIKVQPRNQGKSRVKVGKHGFITLYYILRIGIALRTRRLRQWLRPLQFSR